MELYVPGANTIVCPPPNPATAELKLLGLTVALPVAGWQSGGGGGTTPGGGAAGGAGQFKIAKYPVLCAIASPDINQSRDEAHKAHIALIMRFFTASTDKYCVFILLYFRFALSAGSPGSRRLDRGIRRSLPGRHKDI